MSRDTDLVAAAWHTLLYTGLFMPVSVVGGLLLAVALNRRIRFIGLYRTAIFVPYVASAAVTGLLANFVFNPEVGVVNNVFRVLGLPQQGWLEDPSQAMVVLVIMSLWGQLGVRHRDLPRRAAGRRHRVPRGRRGRRRERRPAVPAHHRYRRSLPRRSSW